MVLVKVFARPLWEPFYLHLLGKRTVADVQTEFGDKVENHLLTYFTDASISYPPDGIALLIFKKERNIELWAAANNLRHFVRSYPILGASGICGPKLQRGDGQVPEGIYKIVALHPNSIFHLSMKLNYPNEFDYHKAREDGRTDLGDDIFIHGESSSVGCIAIGNSNIEDLFILTSYVGLDNVEVIIAPYDMRDGQQELKDIIDPIWLPELYRHVHNALMPFHIHIEKQGQSRNTYL